MSLSRYSRIVVFDSPVRENFYPLSLTRPTFDFLCGTRSLLENIEHALERKVTDLIVPKYLEEICKEQHPGVSVNGSDTGRCIAINALISPTFPLASELPRALDAHNGDIVAQDEEANVIFGAFENFRPEALVASRNEKGFDAKIYRTESGNIPLLAFTWQLVSLNSQAILIQSADSGMSSDQNCEVLGSRLHAKESAEIQRNVTIDTRKGDVVIGDDVVVESLSQITGPAFIGKGSVVKSARIREGTSIGATSRIGGEVEDSIIFDFTNKSHDGFIGHSIVGSWVNLGALTTNSDLKNTYGKIKVNLQSKGAINTDLRKVGCIIGDMAKSSIGTLIMSGRTIGTSSQVFGTVTEDVPSFTLYAKSLGTESRELYVESAIETQRRMMARRNITMSDKYSDMIKAVHNLTSKERVSMNIKKGRFQF